MKTLKPLFLTLALSTFASTHATETSERYPQELGSNTEMVVQALLDNPNSLKKLRKIMKGNPIDSVTVFQRDEKRTEINISGSLYSTPGDDLNYGWGVLEMIRVKDQNGVKYEDINVYMQEH